MGMRGLYAAASAIAIGVGALALPASAFAQEKKASESTTLGEVVVTAQKRSENLQKIPVAVTAFTSQVRDRSGINTAQQILNFTPGVTYDPSTDHLDVRGVGRVTTYIGTDPGVAVYQDGFYVGTPSQLTQSTLLQQRVEILRGPQGTLYGRNSIGGAVNSISRRPDNEFTGEIRAGWNDYVGQTVEGRVSGPVTDWLKLSVYAQQWSQDHSYYTNVPPHTAASTNSTPADPLNGKPALPAFPAATCDSLNYASVQPLTCNSFRGEPGWGGSGRGWTADFQASYEFGPNFDGWLKVNFSNQNTNDQGAAGITPWNPINLTAPSVFYGFQGSQDPGIYNQRNFTANRPNVDPQATKQIITQDTWHGSGFDVKFTGGWWDHTSRFSEDGDAVPIPSSGIYSPTFFGSGTTAKTTTTDGTVFTPVYLGTLPGGVANPVADPMHPAVNTVVNANNLAVIEPYHIQAWSTELNIASTDKGPLQWLVGAYYYNEHTRSDFTYQELDTPQYDHVTDYLFNTQHTCYPVLTTVGDTVYNVNASNGASCPLAAFGVGTVAQVFGYNGTTPSTINNSPGGALNKAFGLDGGIGAGCLYCFNADLKTQSEALFAQIDWRPNDQWHITGGARYSWDQKQGYEQETDVFWIPLVATQEQAAALGFPIDPATGKYVTDYVGTSCSTPGQFGIQPYNATTSCPAHRSLRSSWQAPTGTFGVEWTPNNDTNLYARYNRGYKSGGFNLGPLPSPGPLQEQTVEAIEVKPEYIDDFEGGWKQTFLDHRLQVNVAAFYYLYHGLQALNATTQNSSPPIQINELVNLPKAHSWGVEFEGQWSPIDNLLIAVNYSYLNTSNDSECTYTPGFNQVEVTPGNPENVKAANCFVDSANPAANSTINGQSVSVRPAGPYTVDNNGNWLQGQNLKGSVLPYSPTHKVSANVSYTLKFEPGDLTLSAVENWHSAFYDNLFATSEWLVPEGKTTDFRVTWTSRNRHYTVIGTVSNAFNENVWTAYTTLPPGNAYYAFNSLQPPRVFSVELRYKF
jgi:iron complex outermembrane receptor protein